MVMTQVYTTTFISLKRIMFPLHRSDFIHTDIKTGNIEILALCIVTFFKNVYTLNILFFLFQS